MALYCCYLSKVTGQMHGFDVSVLGKNYTTQGIDEIIQNNGGLNWEVIEADSLLSAFRIAQGRRASDLTT